METEEKLLETLKDWRFLNNRLAKLKRDLQAKEYKTTTTFSDAKVFVTGSSSNKLESFCFSRMKIQDEIDDIERRLNLCRAAYQSANLTNLEKMTVRYTCDRKSLLRIANRFNIAQARIYRIRDRAVSKMFATLQNERKN